MIWQWRRPHFGESQMGPLTWGLKGACFPRAAAEPMSMNATLTPGLQLLLAAFVMFPEITMRTCAWHGEQECTNAESIQTTAIVGNCGILRAADHHVCAQLCASATPAQSSLQRCACAPHHLRNSFRKGFQAQVKTPSVQIKLRFRSRQAL